MIRKTSQPRPRTAGGRAIGPALALAGAVFMSLLVLGARKGTGQEKAAAGAQAAKPAQEWTIESHDRTNFPLTGKHRSLGCRECHINLVFEGTPTDCEVCHWQRRQDDRYSLRLGTQCSECHTPQGWKKVDPSRWSHETEAGYRLEGVHRTLDCEACHGSGGFAPQPTACYSCHEADYRGTRDPNHVQANFPTDCAECHNQRSFDDAAFDHSFFPLQGRHSEASCSDCHADGVYEGTSSDCSSCHLDDYNGTTDPDHRALGFPTDCAACHGTSAAGFDGASFSHDFPIRTGRHSGLSCSDCHKTSNPQVFTCLECHAHQQADMNSQHNHVSGYQYSSPACFACHPQGSGSPSTKASRS
jgi:hypothetical protein